MLRRSIGLVAIPLLAAALAACSKNAATGKNILTLGMSRDQEIALGSEAAPEFTKEYGGAVNSPALQKYVTEIGKKMAAKTEASNPTLPWEFTLLNTQVVNAFALPGGKVFFTRGLAEKLTSEAQMAGVLGHEIGHVTAQHGAQRIASTTLFNAGVAVGAAVVTTSGNQRVREIGGYGIPAVAVGGNLVMLKFSRNEELEADRLGMRYMSSVGYNPKGQLEVMQVLRELSKGNSTPAILSTHPDPDARVEAIQQLLSTEYAGTQNDPKFQEFRDRYKKEFLDVLANIPKPPPPAPAPAAAPKAAFPLRPLQRPVYAMTSGWCEHCAKAQESGPVPPREGVYAFVAPPPAQ